MSRENGRPDGTKEILANVISTKRIVPMGLGQNPVVDVYGRILITKHLKLTRMPYGAMGFVNRSYIQNQLIINHYPVEL